MSRSNHSNLTNILTPQSIAIIGASKDPTKRGFQALKALLRDNYQGQIYPIHPREETILGIPVFTSVLDIESKIDMALICTPAKTLPLILQQCGEKQIKGAVILGAGFSESGEKGRQLEAEVVRVARQFKVRIIGPNTSGIFNLHNKMDLVGYTGLQPGSLGIVSQSGNMALTLVTEGSLNGHIGFSTYIGVGNQADVRFSEYLEYFAQDSNTIVPILYVEGFKNGQQFLKVARKATQHKPVVVYKSGRTSAGQQSASSHTGALAGSFDLTVDVLRQAGVTVAWESDKILPVAETLSLSPVAKGNHIAVLADGGGHATIATDALVEAGLELAQINESTHQRLTEILPAAASLANPIDVAGGSDDNPGVLAECAQILLSDSNVAAVLMVGLFGGYGIRFSETLKQNEVQAGVRLGGLAKQYGKPLILQSLYEPMKPEPLLRVREAGTPVYSSIETAVSCMVAVIDYSQNKQRNANAKFPVPSENKPDTEFIIDQALGDGRTSLYEYEAMDLLEGFGVNTPERAVVRDESDICAVIERFGNSPVAMKVVSKDILHKSDAGGVKLNICGETDMRDNYKQILENSYQYFEEADIEGVLVSPMAKSGVEVIIGVVQDQIFGPVMMFGLGGIFVEVLKDVVFRAIPLSEQDAYQMLDEIKSSKILKGVRGKPAVNHQALVDLMMRVSTLVQEHPDITEVDLNPVIAREDGYAVVDARIILSDESNSTTMH